MPTASGKFQLQDYDAALTVRGFDGFQPSERYQLINLGYRYVARKFPFAWEEASQDYAIAAGTDKTAIGGGAPSSVDSVRSVYITTDPYRRKLEPEEEHRFMEKWLYLDLTSAANRGIPSQYYIFEGNLYLLPPPQALMTARVHYHQYLPDMVATTDVTAIPQILDEIVLDAALVRCHRRAKELELAADAQSRVDEAIGDMLQDDAWQMEELQERVLPDNQWL